MPLVGLTSDLTTLRYGGDRPGGGWSGQPYVQSPNPNLPPNVSAEALQLFNDFYRANKTTSDFPVRGGVLGLLETPASRIDQARIAAFLADRTKGTIFKLKQQGLQLSNPNIQVPTIVGTSDQFPLLETTRFYRPDAANTLLQTKLQGTGFHIPRHGLSPILAVPYQSTYEYVVTKNNTPLSNRLAVLTTLKINTPLITRNTGTFDQEQANNPTILGFANKYGISPLTHQVLNYPGGPGSVYGIGNTIIRRPTDTTQAHDKGVGLYNALTLTYAQLAEASNETANPGNRSMPKRIDFRKYLDPRRVPRVVDSETNQWFDPSLTGDPGRVPSTRRVVYNTSTRNDNGVDEVSAQLPFYYNTKQPYWELQGSGVSVKDIIKFGFECIDNDDPNNTVALVFRAFLTNFTDNHQAELNSFKYLGRGETFRTYQGFDRSIGFSFKIAAQSRHELQPLYKKLNHLMSQLYPDYSATGLMRGSVVKLTIGDYLYRVPGFLESINVTVDDNYPWEIVLNPLLDTDVNQVPQVIDVQCSFKPIHNFLPRRETRTNPFVPLVGSTDPAGATGWLNTGIRNLTPEKTEAERQQEARQEVESLLNPFPENFLFQP